MTKPDGIKLWFKFLFQGFTPMSNSSPPSAKSLTNDPLESPDAWIVMGETDELSIPNYDSIYNLMDIVWYQENVISLANPLYLDLSSHRPSSINVGSNHVPSVYSDTTPPIKSAKKASVSGYSLVEDEVHYKSSISASESNTESKLEREGKSDGDLYKLRRRKAKSKRRTKPLRRSASVGMYERDSEEADITSRTDSAPIDDSPPLFVKNNDLIPRASATTNVNYSFIDDSIQEEECSSRSLTHADLEELRGFCDLGFEFPRDNINPRIAATLPALKLLHAVEDVQERLLRHITPKASDTPHGFNSQALYPLGEPWMVPSYNNKTADMKMHLKVWAQAVACTVRQAC